MHTTKYKNCGPWMEVVKAYDPGFAVAIGCLHKAICMADDIADRALGTQNVSECLWLGMKGIGRLIDRPLVWHRYENILERIYQSEIDNLKFYPGEKSVEDELKVWIGRAVFLDLYFTAWCCVDETFDTPENWEWYGKLKRHCLILDDCRDIETDTFEDLEQCRRNFVVLRRFGTEGYYGWREKKEQLKQAAREVRESLKLEEPPDKRMMIFHGGNHA